MTCQSLVSDLSGVESPSARDKGTSPVRAEAAAIPPSGRWHTAPPAVCQRLLGGVAAASGRHRHVQMVKLCLLKHCEMELASRRDLTLRVPAIECIKTVFWW